MNNYLKFIFMIKEYVKKIPQKDFILIILIIKNYLKIVKNIWRLK